jgi:hypothetical protein
MLTSIGAVILAVIGILVLAAVLAGFAYLCFLVGVGAVRGFFKHLAEQAGFSKLVDALLFGPLAAGMAIVGFGLAALSVISVPLLVVNWLAPQVMAQAASWLDGPVVTTVTTRLAIITYELLFGCFALGLSLTFLRGALLLARKLHSFSEFLALLMGLGLGVVFFYISFELFAEMLTGRAIQL